MRVVTTKIRQYYTGGMYATQAQWENPRVVLLWTTVAHNPLWKKTHPPTSIKFFK
jgi:hypothetical protein